MPPLLLPEYPPPPPQPWNSKRTVPPARPPQNSLRVMLMRRLLVDTAARAVAAPYIPDHGPTGLPNVATPRIEGAATAFPGGDSIRRPEYDRSVGSTIAEVTHESIDSNFVGTCGRCRRSHRVVGRLRRWRRRIFRRWRHDG